MDLFKNYLFSVRPKAINLLKEQQKFVNMNQQLTEVPNIKSQNKPRWLQKRLSLTGFFKAANSNFRLCGWCV